MTAFITAAHALMWLLVGIGAICVLSWAVCAAWLFIEARDRRHDAEDAQTWGPRLAYPLPDVDADDDAFDDWAREVVGLRRVPFRESETFARIAAVIAHNEAQRTDWDHWADHFGGEAS